MGVMSRIQGLQYHRKMLCLDVSWCMVGPDQSLFQNYTDRGYPSWLQSVDFDPMQRISEAYQLQKLKAINARSLGKTIFHQKVSRLTRSLNLGSLLFSSHYASLLYLP